MDAADTFWFEETRRSYKKDSADYLIMKSNLWLRLAAGLAGMLLPLVLVAGEWLFLDGRISARGSLSAYYHSGMRDVFVVVMALTGAILIAYKFSKGFKAENLISTGAGAAALTVAFFPNNVPDETIPITPLQDYIGPEIVDNIHGTAAVAFVALIAWMCYRFGRREWMRANEIRPESTSGRVRNAFRWVIHFVCAGFIAGAGIFWIVTWRLDLWDSWRVFTAETIAAEAFGLSWVYKGAELEVLLPRFAAVLRKFFGADVEFGGPPSAVPG